MIQTLKRFVTSVTIFSMLFTPIAAPVAVYAATDSPDIEGGLCAGTNLDATNTQCDPDAEADTANQKINDILKLVINLFSLVVGVVSVIMIIVGGLKYITSGGDSGNVTGAKNTILYAVIGLVVVALAQFIVRFVLSKVTTAGE
jgi:hypothetical protein